MSDLKEYTEEYKHSCTQNADLMHCRRIWNAYKRNINTGFGKVEKCNLKNGKTAMTLYF